jgi:hypothetical protein
MSKSSNLLRTFYVEEKIKVLEGVIQQADPILIELFKYIEDFQNILILNSEEVRDKIDKIKFIDGEEEI